MSLNKKFRRRAALIYALFLIMAIFSLREFTLTGNNASIHSWVGDPDLFYKLYLQPYSWNEHLSRSESVVQFLSRLFYLPFIVISKRIGSSMFQILPWIYVILFSLSGFSMFLLVFYLIKGWKKGIIAYMSSFLAGLFYMSYPFFAISELTELFVILGFSLFPLVVLTFFRGVRESSYKHIVLSAILGTYSAFWDVRYLFLTFFVYISYSIYYLFIHRFQRHLLKKLLTAWVVLLAVFSLFGGLSLFVFASSQSEAVQTPLNKEAYQILWKEATPIKLLNGFSWPTISEQIERDKLIVPEGIHQAISLVLPIISLSIFISRKRIPCREVYYFGLLLALTLALFSSMNFVDWLVMRSPYNFYIGRMFRAPRIPAQLIAISTSVLFGISVERILNITIRRYFLSIMLVIAILSNVIITAFPFFTYGTISTWFTTFTPSSEYMEANDFLKQMNASRVVWFPTPPLSSPTWYTPRSGKSYFYVNNSKAPTVWPAGNRWVYFIDFAFLSKHSLLRIGDIKSLADILSSAGIYYIVISKETSYSQKIIDQMIRELNESTSFELVFSNGKYYIYKIDEASSSKVLIKPFISL